jgi:hypothetical protein
MATRGNESAEAGKHIHIVGGTGRSGTTLMQELMVSCFEIDHFGEFEQGFYKAPLKFSGVMSSKKPFEARYMPCALKHNPHLYVIYMLRDPRDVVVSELGGPGHYFSDMGLWLESDRIAQRLKKHSRFIVVRYEDLVREPDQVQQQLQQRLPFLRQRCLFSEFHLQNRQRSDNALRAMNGLRAPSPSSIGRWQQHLPRLVAQLAHHGDITPQLVAHGYETDGRWLERLQGIEASADSPFDGRFSGIRGCKRRLKTYRRCFKYWLRTRLARMA